MQRSSRWKIKWPSVSSLLLLSSSHQNLRLDLRERISKSTWNIQIISRSASKLLLISHSFYCHSLADSPHLQAYIEQSFKSVVNETSYMSEYEVWEPLVDA